MTADLESGQFNLPVALEQFNNLLNEKPPKEVIQTREVGNGRNKRVIQYLPIDYVQKRLITIFGGYQTLNFRTQTIMNEVVGAVDLVVFHPVFKKFMTHQGAAAVMIQQWSGAKPDEVEKKYHNALEGGYPHLLSDCIVNAAKKWGDTFGGYFNRKHAFEYQPVYLNSAAQLSEAKEAISMLEKSAHALKVYKKQVDGMTFLKLKNDGTKFFDAIVKEAVLVQGDMIDLKNYTRSRYDALNPSRAIDSPEKNSK